MDANKTAGEETRWQLYKNAACNPEQVLAQQPTRHQLYSHLPPITKTIQVRRTRHAGHCWRSRDELIRDVLLWIPTHGRAKAGRPARTYIQQLCEDTGCCPEDLPRAMNDREEWRERVRDIRAASTIWWWWWYLTMNRTIVSTTYTSQGWLGCNHNNIRSRLSTNLQNRGHTIGWNLVSYPGQRFRSKVLPHRQGVHSTFSIYRLGNRMFGLWGHRSKIRQGTKQEIGLNTELNLKKKKSMNTRDPQTRRAVQIEYLNWNIENVEKTVPYCQENLFSISMPKARVQFRVDMASLYVKKKSLYRCLFASEDKNICLQQT